MPLMQTVYTGAMPDELEGVLDLARIGFTVSSNFARYHAVSVALAASNGWISTVTADGRGYSAFWSLTMAGMTMRDHGLKDD